MKTKAITGIMLSVFIASMVSMPFNMVSGHSGVIEIPLPKVESQGSAKILVGLYGYIGYDLWKDFMVELQTLGYTIDMLPTEEITSDTLQGYDVLTIGCAWSEFSTSELQAIEDFVSNGGGLFLVGVGWSWIDYHPGTTIQDYPINKIASRFGLFFNDDVILDPTDNTGDPGNPVFHRMLPHPITEYIGVISVARGNPSSISADSAQILITGDEDSYSGYHERIYEVGDYPPVLAVTFHGTGRVVCLGHDGFFASVDDDGNGVINLYEYDNLQLGLNIINWLSLPPTVETTDETGERRNVFDIPETVYVRGSGYSPSTTYDLYLVEDITWSDETDIPDRVSGTETSVTADENGDIPSGTVAWNGQLAPGKYDIVIDVNGNGKYDEDIDALDDEDIEVTAGFFVVPEVGTILVFIGCFAAFVVFGISKSKRWHL